MVLAVTVAAVAPVLKMLTDRLLVALLGMVPKSSAAGPAASPDRVPSPFRSNPTVPALVVKVAAPEADPLVFGVKVTGVWTSQQRGKTRKVGATSGLRPRWKKAIVKLKAGDTIEIFEG